MKKTPVDPRFIYDRRKAWLSLLQTHVPMVAVFFYTWIKNGTWPVYIWGLELFISGIVYFFCGMKWSFMIEDKYTGEDRTMPEATPGTVTNFEYPPRITNEPEINLQRFRCRKWFVTMLIIGYAGMIKRFIDIFFR